MAYRLCDGFRGRDRRSLGLEVPEAGYRGDGDIERDVYKRQVVDNVATMVSIYQAVVEGKPSMERVVTVSGNAVNEPGNFRVPFGMNQAELVEAAGGFKTEPEKLISGGPMMGFAMFTLDVPVTKTSSSILGFTKDEVAQFEPSACINCGRCVDACPSRLIPSRLADYAEHHNEERCV